jgi:nicotinamidase-related amidase
MTSEPKRDPMTDHLITPENSALVIIDYQAELISAVRSIDQDLLTNNVVALAKTARAFDVPVVLSTVGVAIGANTPTVDAVQSVLPDVEPLDRTTLNGWEDLEFREAVTALGRPKLLMTGLWTGGCPAFTTLDALRAGLEVYAVSDAMGETSLDAHERAMQRMIKAGADPITWEVILGELQRDYQREATLPAIVDILGEHLFAVQPPAVSALPEALAKH